MNEQKFKQIMYDISKEMKNHLREQHEFYEFIDQIIELLGKKRQDYGESFEKIWMKVGPLSAVVRLMDKVERLYGLISADKKPTNESVEDTFKDIIGYCLLSLLMMKSEGLMKKIKDYINHKFKYD